jgi:hypothetical protein
MRLGKEFLLALVTLLALAACSGQPGESQSGAIPTEAAGTAGIEGEDYEIVTLLPADAIPSIDNPQFYGVDQADAEYEPDETVIGLEIDGEARAYSTALLSSHEIVNDEVNGRPIAVTW